MYRVLKVAYGPAEATDGHLPGRETIWWLCDADPGLDTERGVWCVLPAGGGRSGFAL